MKVKEFSPPNKLKTPVLFLVFNRLETTIQVFEEIKKVKPPRLYIASDGPRSNKIGELEKVNAIRIFLLENIDWECKIKTLFRDENLGCKYAVSDAINWFFDNEEMGIILEDDCLPHNSFFWFCEELLIKYKYDLRIWHISGNNFQNGIKRGNASYYFSKINHIWGWASWANRWSNYDVEIESFERFKKTKKIKSIFNKKIDQRYWESTFQNVFKGGIDTWDYQWTYTFLVNNGLSILPNQNLISNIGFGIEATHTHDSNSSLSNLPTYSISLPLKHPEFIIADFEADLYTLKKNFTKNFYLRNFIKLFK